MLKVRYPCITNPSATKYCYFVRLACLIHAVSIQSEPRSNSHEKKILENSIQFILNLIYFILRINNRRFKPTLLNRTSSIVCKLMFVKTLASYLHIVSLSLSKKQTLKLGDFSFLLYLRHRLIYQFRSLRSYQYIKSAFISQALFERKKYILPKRLKSRHLRSFF